MFKRYVYAEGLTNLHGSNGKFLINTKGQVKDSDGNDIPFTLDGEGNKVVYCLSWDGERNYRVVDLMAIQFKNLHIPESAYNKVIAFYIDGNRENLHASNIGYRFEGGKLEVKECPGYYYVPGFTSVAVNIDGCLVSTRNFKPLKWHRTKPIPARNIAGGYFMASVVVVRGTQVMMARHRAMCLVFNGYPDNVDKLTVNHKDSIPGNDHPDNLEWLSYSENSRHARANNLRSQQMAVLTRDVNTGEVKEYLSLGECAKALGLKGAEAVRFRIVNSRFCQVFGNGLQMKFKSDPRDWIDPKDVDMGPRVYNFIARNIYTGEEHVFDDIDKVSSIIPDSHPRPIQNRLNIRSFEIYRGYQFKMVDDDRPFPVISSKELETSNPVSGYKVDARNVLTGETRTYDTIRQAAKDFNSYVSMALRDGKQPIYEGGWQLKLSTDTWNTTDDYDAEVYKSQNNIMAIELSTGKVTLAESISAMSRVLGLDYREVEEAAYSRGNKICHGYRIRLGISNEAWPTTQAT